MCRDPRTHDAWRTAAALVEAHIHGDTTGNDLLLTRDGDARYPLDVLAALAGMAYPLAVRLGHREIAASCALMTRCADDGRLNVDRQLAADSRESAAWTAEYMAVVLVDKMGREKALGMARRWIAGLAQVGV